MRQSRRDILRAGALAALAVPFAAPLSAFAKAPMAGTQAASIFRTKVGGYEVTAINDGTLQLDLKLFPSADPAQAKALLDSAFPKAAAIPTSVNAYLVNTGDKLVLIDTGTANAFGPILGHLAANLRAAGIDPAQVDAVLLTHLHPDHEGGLLTDGAIAFPNAQVFVAEAERKFWFDDGILAQAPEGAKGSFAMARAALAPYEKAGRVTLFGTDSEVIPGIASVSAPGHTPGHTMFRIGSGTDTLLVWGDVIATVALQFPHPDWGMAFDTDQKQAAETRRRVLDMVSANRERVAGAHVAFPGLGHVEKRGEGYAFQPGFWDTTL